MSVHKSARWKVCEEFTEYEKSKDKGDGCHDDDVMTDAHADLKPTARVTDKEEEILKKTKKSKEKLNDGDLVNRLVKFMKRLKQYLLLRAQKNQLSE